MGFWMGSDRWGPLALLRLDFPMAIERSFDDGELDVRACEEVMSACGASPKPMHLSSLLDFAWDRSARFSPRSRRLVTRVGFLTVRVRRTT